MDQCVEGKFCINKPPELIPKAKIRWIFMIVRVSYQIRPSAR